jgi:hypothetical protein
MKPFLLLLLVLTFSFSCRNKKIETANTDSVAADTTATQPVAAQLAFSPIDTYVLKSSIKAPDSVTFLILADQSELDRLVSVDKTTPESGNPDFIINHTIAIVCPSTNANTNIEVENVELGESTINVFSKIIEGEKGNALSTPVRLFAIEKRDGVTGMDFYLNGKKSVSLMLPSF